MVYWLFKSEPGVWSWDMQKAKGKTGEEWTGVRNYQARNNMRLMKLGDKGFFYHSNESKAIVGVVEVCKLAHKDSTADVDTWDCVDIRALMEVPKPVTLDDIKLDKRLKDMVLVKNSRLSVQPVTAEEWKIICDLGGVKIFAAPDVNRQDFIHQNTVVMTPPLVPEVKLHLAHEAVPLWQKTEEELGEMGLPPPFWAFAWAGGQALARYVLDYSHLIKSLKILDLATGSGLVAIAASQAGAATTIAADIDEFATTAAQMNAELNHVSLDIKLEDLLQQQPPSADVILVGDLFYEKSLAARCLEWLRQAQRHGARVLIGDPGRSYLPKDQLEKLAEYNVPVTRDLEDAEIKKTAVWQLKA